MADERTIKLTSTQIPYLELVIHVPAQELGAIELHGEGDRGASPVADALTGVEVPDLGRQVPRTSDETMVLKLQAADLAVVTSEGVRAFSGVEVPYTKGLVLGTCDQDVPIVLQTAHGLGVTLQLVQ